MEVIRNKVMPGVLSSISELTKAFLVDVADGLADRTFREDGIRAGSCARGFTSHCCSYEVLVEEQRSLGAAKKSSRSVSMLPNICQA